MYLLLLILFTIKIYTQINIFNLASIIDGSVITCDEIIDVEAKSNHKQTKTVPKNFNKKT